MARAFTLLLILFSLQALGFKDTLINEEYYLILERYENGTVKKVGQFMPSCFADRQEKCGYFHSYKKDGKIKNTQIYFYGKRHNKKILGIKYGWWGLWGLQEKYFLGFKSKIVIVDPCF
ncbi:MAG: hypothetical protein MK078_15755 [Crocinitomicaceae bacterium]|nr:hypothetical protein [Crocinitomicaceae bacterium]